MGKPQFGVKLDEPRQQAVLSVVDEAGHITEARFDAGALSLVIEALLEVRWKMAEPVPLKLDTDPPLGLAKAPAWGMRRAETGDIVFMLRHPGAGWLGFALEPKRAAEIAAGLEQRMAGGKAN